jgi:hypothetical protein
MHVFSSPEQQRPHECHLKGGRPLWEVPGLLEQLEQECCHQHSLEVVLAPPTRHVPDQVKHAHVRVGVAAVRGLVDALVSVESVFGVEKVIYRAAYDHPVGEPRNLAAAETGQDLVDLALVSEVININCEFSNFESKSFIIFLIIERKFVLCIPSNPSLTSDPPSDHNY